MPCPHAAAPELSAYADGELTGAAHAWWEGHVRVCVRCREEVARVHALSTALRAGLPTSEPSPAFRETLRRAMRGQAVGQGDSTPLAPAPARHPPATLRLATAAVVLLAAGFGLGRLGAPGHESATEALAPQVVAAHVRSLQVDHLVDVASSEHHVVKPWFAGKLDFSPPVPDLAADGFPMAGGRVDYLGERPLAALVYARGPHRINLFVWPAGSAGVCRQEPPVVRQGFNLVRGRTAAMEFWAVSDLNAEELRAFAAAWRRQAGSLDGTCPG